MLLNLRNCILWLTLEDNFPTTNLESLACGTPVITFDTGGSKDAIDINTGRVVKKGDENMLEAMIIKLGKIFKKENSHHCTERAKELFDKNKRYMDYLALYKEIAGQNG
jgi:putative colanic acid biosynthesis glycosyltransferase